MSSPSPILQNKYIEIKGQKQCADEGEHQSYSLTQPVLCCRKPAFRSGSPDSLFFQLQGFQAECGKKNCCYNLESNLQDCQYFIYLLIQFTWLPINHAELNINKGFLKNSNKTTSRPPQNQIYHLAIPEAHTNILTQSLGEEPDLHSLRKGQQNRGSIYFGGESDIQGRCHDREDSLPRAYQVTLFY